MLMPLVLMLTMLAGPASDIKERMMLFRKTSSQETSTPHPKPLVQGYCYLCLRGEVPLSSYIPEPGVLGSYY